MFYRPLKFIFFAILGVLPAGLGAQTPPLPVTLPEDFLPGLRDILHHALQQSPQMILRDIDLATQEANVYQAASSEWPSVNGYLGYIDYHSAVGLGETFSSSSASSQGPIYALSVTQPLYHWGALRAAADVSHIQIKISESQYADAYRQLATTIRAQYLSLIMQKMQIRNAHFAFDQASVSFAEVQERFKNKAATENDLNNAQLAVDDANLAVDRAAEEFAHAKRLLMLMVGLSELSDAAVPDDVPKPAYSPAAPAALMQDFERDGLNQTFQARVYSYQIKQSDLNYKIAKYRLYPRLDLSFNLSEQYQTQSTVLANGGTGITEKAFYYNTAMVVANWNIFDGFATRGAKLAALASKRFSERALQTYLDQTLEQARYMKRQLDFSTRAMAITEIHFVGSEQNLEEMKNRCKNGTASKADVAQATGNFYQMQAAAFSARIDFFSRWSDYVSLLGLDPALNNIPAHFTANAK